MKFIFKLFLVVMLTFNVFASDIKVNAEGKFTNLKAFNDSIYLFDLRNVVINKIDEKGNLKATFNKKGEGPQELKFIADFFFIDKEISLFSLDKCVKLNNELSFVSESATTTPFIEFKNQSKLIWKQERNKEGVNYSFYLVDKNKKETSVTNVIQNINGQKMPAIVTFIKPKPLPGKDKFALIDSSLNKINIFSQDGKLINAIEIKGKTKAVDENFKNEFFKSIFRDPRFQNNKKMQEQVKQMVDFPKEFPAVQDFYIDHKTEKMYVKTYEKEKENSIFLQYDLSGKFIKKISLKDKNIDISNQSNFTSFDNNTYYYLYEDKNGEYKVHKEIIK